MKDNINEMIRNLKDTTLRNEDAGLVETTLTRFTLMLQGQRDLLTVGNLILSELAPWSRPSKASLLMNGYRKGFVSDVAGQLPPAATANKAARFKLGRAW